MQVTISWSTAKSEQTKPSTNPPVSPGGERYCISGPTYRRPSGTYKSFVQVSAGTRATRVRSKGCPPNSEPGGAGGLAALILELRPPHFHRRTHYTTTSRGLIMLEVPYSQSLRLQIARRLADALAEESGSLYPRYQLQAHRPTEARLVQTNNYKRRAKASTAYRHGLAPSPE